MTELFKKYLQKHQYPHFNLRAILFDMDGVLYNSMPAHARSWQQTMREFGLKQTKHEDFYLHEGRTGESTINLLFERELHREATKAEMERIYQRKTQLFTAYNSGEIIAQAGEVLKFVVSKKLTPVLVTGSGQASLLDKLNKNFPSIFTPETMVTAFDVRKGKPHPEPFLLGLKKGGNLKSNQALVIENAPMGVEAASKAGIFTIAVNTGPLSNSVLTNAGADLIFDSMETLLQKFPEILAITSTVK